MRELGAEGIRWQIQNEIRWLAGLLADEKAVASLLRFLKATETEGREGAKERELECERRIVEIEASCSGMSYSYLRLLNIAGQLCI